MQGSYISPLNSRAFSVRYVIICNICKGAVMRILVTCDVNDEKYNDYTINMYKRFLDAHDFERYFDIKDELRKKVFLIARGELRSKLGAIMHMEPSEIHFSYNAFGKPFISNTEEEYDTFSKDNPAVHFNISHSGCLIALVIASQEIGIDIESIRKRDFARISKKLFKREITDANEFYKTWTTNEAIAKCNGISLLTQAKSYNTDEYDISHTMYQNAMITIASRKQ